MSVVLLTAGPIALLLLICPQHIIGDIKLIHQRRLEAGNGDSWDIQALQILKCIGKVFWNSRNFWISLLVSAGLQIVLIALYVKINPFVGKPINLLTDILTEKLDHPHSSIPCTFRCPVTCLPQHRSCSFWPTSQRRHCFHPGAAKAGDFLTGLCLYLVGSRIKHHIAA